MESRSCIFLRTKSGGKRTVRPMPPTSTPPAGGRYRYGRSMQISGPLFPPDEKKMAGRNGERLGEAGTEVHRY